MKERGVIFTGESVRAILADRKTQTRRLVKYHPALGEPEAWCADVLDTRTKFSAIVGDYRRFSPFDVGARLYVKETWADAGPMYGREADPPQDVAYFADKSAVTFDGDLKPHAAPAADLASWNWDRLRKRSPLFMPRWASRLTLEVVSVRVERLHDITEEDAKTEGVNPRDAAIVFSDDRIVTEMAMTHLGAFACLWDSIHGKRAPWTSNPWVWVVSFRRVSRG